MNGGDTYLDLIARNKRNSVLLVAAFIVVVGLSVGTMLAAFIGGDVMTSTWAVYAAFVVTCGIAAWSYFGGAKAILAVSNASVIEKPDDPELHNVVEEMAIAAGVPAPQVYIIEDTALNAFATGRDPDHAAVAITKGLRERLTRDELQAVIAHEMSHVRHQDIRLTMLLATLVGLVVLVSDFFLHSLRWGAISGGGRRLRGKRSGGGSAAGAIFAVAALLALISPILVRMIQLATSREREYLADAGAVELTRNPGALVSALRKLEQEAIPLKSANRATAHLYIVPPLKDVGKRVTGAFASHPPLTDRIVRIEGLTF